MTSFDISLLERGGPVMWLLLALSLFGFILFVERVLFLHRGQIRSEGFTLGIRNLVENGRLVEALTMCEDTPGPVPGILKAALLHLQSDEAEIRRAMEGAALVEIPTLERRIGAIAAIAKIAPLLGLLGTILAFIEGFFAVGLSADRAYPAFGLLLNSAGEALLTTAAGIGIAIMAHIAHHFLYGRVRALVHDMEYVGHEILQFVLEHQRNERSRD